MFLSKQDFCSQHGLCSKVSSFPLEPKISVAVAGSEGVMALRKARLRATSSLALALAAAQLPRGGRRCRNYKQHDFEGDMCSDLGVSQQMKGREPKNSF